MLTHPINSTQRVEYIDLAKGFCIILVVLLHITIFYHQRLPMPDFWRAFRMPLYFFLSGFFFKTYGGLGSFIKKKTNKLLIPFAFFYLTLSVFLSLFLHNFWGIELEKAQTFEVIPALTEFYGREHFPISAIWFLLCLFEVNILFYLCHLFAGLFKNRLPWLIACSLLIGFTGQMLCRFHINLPMFIDSSMSSLPFFMMGYIINKHSQILHSSKYDNYIPIIIISSAVFIFFFAGRVSYRTNTFAGISYLTCYPCGLLGALSIILIAKLIGHLPLISYWGRYSIMILVTHQLLYQAYAAIMEIIGIRMGGVILNLSLTMLSYLALIPLMRKYLPYVTAQKDLV